jgi:hypothetical protein
MILSSQAGLGYLHIEWSVRLFEVGGSGGGSRPHYLIEVPLLPQCRERDSCGLTLWFDLSALRAPNRKAVGCLLGYHERERVAARRIARLVVHLVTLPTKVAGKRVSGKLARCV